MLLKKWEHLPPEMQLAEVRPYYELLCKRRGYLFAKRCLDLITALLMLLLLSPLFLLLALIIKLDSPGPVFYRQDRVTQYGKIFRIHKFRTMKQNADSELQLTTQGDRRVTRVGRVLRKYRIDEFAQLLDVVSGTLTLVGVRPESPKYVAAYTHEMMATFLLPAGVTNLTSIYYKDEAALLSDVEDIEKAYIETILPKKMHYNLESMKKPGIRNDIKILFMTVLAVFGKNYSEESLQKEPSSVS